MKNSNYILNIFNKSVEEIALEDIKDFFSAPQEETSVLEFKSGNVEIIDVYKEITAFLNTEGGLLIIGSPRERREKRNNNEITICEGEVTYSKFKNKDWIYQKIASNITPTPTELKIFEFITEDGGVFLIDVPQSSVPPHQSSADGKYYIRLEREAKPAPHGIVQALFDKRRKPKLIADITIAHKDRLTDNVKIRITNDSIIPADKVSFIIDIYNVDQVISDFNFRCFDDSLGKKYSMSNKADQVLVQVISIPIDVHIRHKNSEYLIMVGYWCKDLDFDYTFFTYSPLEKKIITKGTLDSGFLFTEELERIKMLPNNV